MADRWQPEAPPIDPVAFEMIVATEPFVVLHFWAVWDAYDRHLDRALQPVRAEFADRVTFRSADVDQPDLVPVCRACDVVNVPALACFVHGQRECTLVGVRSTAELRRLVAGLVGRNQDS
jgi:thioredoxin-like negative regulator of GroEL